MEIKISVVVPTYKRSGLLRNCLWNLCHQTLNKENYEVIIVSDGPDDESREVVNEYEQVGNTNIRFLSLPAKKGPAAARNMGWKNAHGILIAFTDDDCLPDATWLENIWKHYEQEVEIAYTGKVVVPVSEEPTDFELNTKGLETGDFVTANCVCTKITLEAIGGFDEEFSTAWREDSDLEFKLLNRNVPIFKLEDAVVVHPVRIAPWGVSIKEQKKTMFNALLFKKYPGLYRQRIKKRPSLRYYFIVLSFLSIIFSAIFKLEDMVLLSVVCWIASTVDFIMKRLSATRKTRSHILEMIFTSFVIPFLSVYWTIYGAVKYRVLFF